MIKLVVFSYQLTGGLIVANQYDKTNKMISRFIKTIFPFLLLTNCSSDQTSVSDPKQAITSNKESKDTVLVVPANKLKGIDLFIDSMKNENYLLDTIRIRQTTWSVIGKHPKIVDNGHQIIQLPFPLEQYRHHFSNPKTYFFAHWNEEEKTFKNGNDYLLMTWTIDSSGIKNEKEIYKALHIFMGNFPCYIFRKNNTVFAMSHRMTIAASETRKLTERLRDFIDTSIILYLPFDGNEPR